MEIVFKKIKDFLNAFIENKKAVFLFEILLMAFLIFYLLGFYFIFLSKNNNETNISINKGWGLKRIADELYSHKVIKNRFYFEVYAWFTDQAKKIKAGNYIFEKDLNAYEIMKIVTEGRIVKDEVVVTIPEGYNIYQIADKLKQVGLDRDGQFLILAKQPEKFAAKYKFLDCGSDTVKFFGCPADLEGYLFPDTYFFSKEAMAKEIIEKFLDNFENKILSKFFYAIYNSRRSLKDFVIMASLLEKEIRNLDDMPLVSGILWKRFDAGIALQVDASVIYAKCLQNISACKINEPSLKDLGISSPYNTYLKIGLPPGAIANPGLKTIEASIYPQDSDYWYYLSAKDGTTIFSKTLEEHNRNKAKYLN